jgi:holo-[acyl-carrier protein] synthase
MIFGVGTDILELDRIERLLNRFNDRFWTRILTASEQQVYLQKTTLMRSRFLAKRFAAKEAVSKALGTGIAQGVTFHDIEIQNNPTGKPIVLLHNKAQQIALENNITKIHLSLSDERALIAAFVVAEQSTTINSTSQS